VTGAATKAENAADDSKPANDVATKTSGAKKSAADDTEPSKADEDNTPPAKETAKKSAEPSRKGKTSAARPKIEEDEPQAGSVELAAANAASDPARQRQLLWEAVKKGNSDASVKLAELYIMGRGVEKSCDQAMVLLRSASVHASSRARGKLGAMYATGECVPQDRVQAYHWMSMALAANPNSDWTERYRESIWNQMTSSEKVLAKKDR
jgi:TPR repeat protein